MRSLLFMLVFLTGQCLANDDANEITKIYLDYSRSFHERIQITVAVLPDSNVRLVLVRTPLNESGLDSYNSSEKFYDLDRDQLISIYGFYENKDYFLKFKEIYKEESISFDGSSLELRFYINNYYQAITKDSFFGSEMGLHEEALSEVVFLMFQLAHLSINEDELY